MPLTIAELQNLVTYEIGRLTHLSAHTAFPATLANEVAGGSPAYARKPLVWGSVDSSGDVSASEVILDVPPGTIAAVGFCSALTAGEIRADLDVPDETFGTQNQFRYIPRLDGATT